MPKKNAGRRSRLRASAAAPDAGRHSAEPQTLPRNWLNDGIGLILLPLCFVTTQTFLGAFGETAAATSPIGSAPLWFFSVGSVLWLIAFFGLPRPLFVYVLGHELTHAIFVLLCGGKISGFKVRPEGGHIITNKNNLLISLSPYFLPFYSVIAVALSGFVGLFVDISAYHPGALFWGHVGFSWSWVFYAAVGATWCFHLTFTAWMITKNQPDLNQHGTFFSLVIIYLANLLILSAFLIIVSRGITFHGFSYAWLENFSAFFRRLLF